MSLSGERSNRAWEKGEDKHPQPVTVSSPRTKTAEISMGNWGEAAGMRSIPPYLRLLLLLEHSLGLRPHKKPGRQDEGPPW